MFILLTVLSKNTHKFLSECFTVLEHWLWLPCIFTFDTVFIDTICQKKPHQLFLELFLFSHSDFSMICVLAATTNFSHDFIKSRSTSEEESERATKKVNKHLFIFAATWQFVCKNFARHFISLFDNNKYNHVHWRRIFLGHHIIVCTICTAACVSFVW